MTVDGNQKPMRGIITTGNIDGHQKPERVILVNSDNTPVDILHKQADQSDSTATDVAGLKTDFNDLLAKLRSAGVLG